MFTSFNIQSKAVQTGTTGCWVTQADVIQLKDPTLLNSEIKSACSCGWTVLVLYVSHLIPLHLIVNGFGSLGQADGVQVKVAVEDDRATGERSGQRTGKAAQKHILTCRTTKHNMSPRGHTEAGTWSCADDPPVR